MFTSLQSLSSLGSVLILAGGLLQAAEQGPTILERRCLSCHGPSTKTSGLDLSTRKSALQGGSRGPAIDRSDPDGSLLLARVLADEMPPGAPLSVAEKEALQAWIADGAVWLGRITDKRAGKDWWSLQPLQETTPPATVGAPQGWQSSPIDRWIYAGLETNGLRPAPQADRRTLIRRVTFGLTGLPPSPQDIESFVRDPSPNAYEKLIDRLLASPQYGERWARHWLDLVRYAESEGFERDRLREYAWPYRDYVIRSLNEDKSYLQFAREQLAGDAIEPVTHDGIIATSLLTLGPLDAVGLTSTIPRERATIREEYLEEMLSVVGQTFLGLTVNCARCHDHKFDPIAQQEYYRMKAAFEAVWPPTEPASLGTLDEFFPYGRPLLTPGEQRARDERIASIESRIQAIDDERGERYRGVRPIDSFNGFPQPIARWTFDVDGRADFSLLSTRFDGPIETVDGGLRLRPEAIPRQGHERSEDDAVKGPEGIAISALLSREIREKTLETWVHVREKPDKTIVLMELRRLSGRRGASVDSIYFAPKQEPHWENRSNGGFRTQDPGGQTEELEPGDRVHLAISYEADGTITIFRNGEVYGEPYRPDPTTSDGRLQTYSPDDALLRFRASHQLEIEEARLYDSALSATEVAASFQAGIRNFTPGDLRGLMGPEAKGRTAAFETEHKRLQEELESIPEPPLVHGARTRPTGPTHVFLRGDVTQKGPEVAPAGLSCVQGLSADLGLSDAAGAAERRQAMAEWIANPSNPLFSRVMVNRVWQHHFGSGFVPNPSDLGYNGGKPSHPELLEWLASEFIRKDWSLKALHKQILLSRTYRQSSWFHETAAGKDADNRLLWRLAPRRLTGEEVRDAMLSVSGDLNGVMYGPSFRPFEITQKGSLQIYNLTAHDAPEFNRRTVYRMNVNSGGDPMLEALDCPLPSVKTPKRSQTATSLQALSLMNNEFVQRRAEGFAARLRREASGLEEQVEWAFRLAMGRRPSADELSSSRSLAETHGLAALCWGIFNTTEFIYVQ